MQMSGPIAHNQHSFGAVLRRLAEVALTQRQPEVSPPTGWRHGISFITLGSLTTIIIEGIDISEGGGGSLSDIRPGMISKNVLWYPTSMADSCPR